MDDLELLIKAIDFAAVKHRMQRRKDADASPYINHPIALARVLKIEAGISDTTVLCAAFLHDTIEDTQTTAEELSAQFGPKIASIVEEVTDDTTMRREDRKRRQIERAAHISSEAQLVKLADKICNLRDMADAPPSRWDLQRRKEYFDWAKAVVDQLRGAHPELERIFDRAYARKP